jgi:hypothetical protein
MMVQRWSVLGVLAAALLAGCSNVGSEVDSIVSAATGREETVLGAVNNVLLREGVDVLVWPVCESAGKTVTCRGTTVSGDDIVVDAPPVTPITVTLTVGGRALYSGSAQAVLDEAAGKTP